MRASKMLLSSSKALENSNSPPVVSMAANYSMAGKYNNNNQWRVCIIYTHFNMILTFTKILYTNQ